MLVYHCRSTRLQWLLSVSPKRIYQRLRRCWVRRLKYYRNYRNPVKIIRTSLLLWNARRLQPTFSWSWNTVTEEIWRTTCIWRAHCVKTQLGCFFGRLRQRCMPYTARASFTGTWSLRIYFCVTQGFILPHQKSLWKSLILDSQEFFKKAWWQLHCAVPRCIWFVFSSELFDLIHWQWLTLAFEKTGIKRSQRERFVINILLMTFFSIYIYIYTHFVVICYHLLYLISLQYQRVSNVSLPFAALLFLRQVWTWLEKH